MLNKLLVKSIMKSLVKVGHKSRDTKEAKKIFNSVTDTKTPEEYWRTRESD